VVAAVLAVCGRAFLDVSRGAEPRPVDVAGTQAFDGLVNASLGRQAVASVPADRAAMGAAPTTPPATSASPWWAMLINRGGASDPAATVSGWNMESI
jgi:hypothetical protein